MHSGLNDSMCTYQYFKINRSLPQFHLWRSEDDYIHTSPDVQMKSCWNKQKKIHCLLYPTITPNSDSCSHSVPETEHLPHSFSWSGTDIWRHIFIPKLGWIPFGGEEGRRTRIWKLKGSGLVIYITFSQAKHQKQQAVGNTCMIQQAEARS